jgi:peptidoglycan L-alanyl-D-glutamate endopeptidase CwlK
MGVLCLDGRNLANESAMLLPSTILLLSLLAVSCALWPLLGEGGRRALHHALANLGFTPLRPLLPTLGLLLCAIPLAAWLSSQPDAPGRADRARSDAGDFAWPEPEPERMDPAYDRDTMMPPAPSPPLPPLPADLLTPWRRPPGAVNRDWRLLDNEFARRLALVFKIMKQVYGYDMALVEGYRSAERQNVLADAGAHVTGARGFQSYHQQGLAADCAFLRGGAWHISEQDPWTMRGYRLYGAVAESVGLRWGGRWAMKDFGHAELARAPINVHQAR